MAFTISVVYSFTLLVSLRLFLQLFSWHINMLSSGNIFRVNLNQLLSNKQNRTDVDFIGYIFQLETWNWFASVLTSWLMRPFSQNYNLAYHTTHIAVGVIIIIIHKRWDLKFSETFHGNFSLHSERLCQKTGETEFAKRNIFFSDFILFGIFERRLESILE